MHLGLLIDGSADRREQGARLAGSVHDQHHAAGTQGLPNLCLGEGTHQDHREGACRDSGLRQGSGSLPCRRRVCAGRHQDDLGTFVSLDIHQLRRPAGAIAHRSQHLPRQIDDPVGTCVRLGSSGIGGEQVRDQAGLGQVDQVQVLRQGGRQGAQTGPAQPAAQEMRRQAVVGGLLHRGGGELEGSAPLKARRSVHVVHTGCLGNRDTVRSADARPVDQARGAHAGHRQALGNRRISRHRVSGDGPLDPSDCLRASKYRLRLLREPRLHDGSPPLGSDLVTAEFGVERGDLLVPRRGDARGRVLVVAIQ